MDLPSGELAWAGAVRQLVHPLDVDRRKRGEVQTRKRGFMMHDRLDHETLPTMYSQKSELGNDMIA